MTYNTPQGMMSQEEYVAKAGELCPFCHSKNILRISNINPETGISEVECHDCGRLWYETYTISGYIHAYHD